MKNKVLSVLLCCALICSMMAMPQTHIQEPAHAELVLTASSAMIAAAVAMLTAMGITFVTTGDAQKAAQAFVNSSQEVHDLFRDFVDNLNSGGSSNNGNGDGSNKIMLSAACSGALASLFAKAKDYFHIGSVDTGSVPVPNDLFYSCNGLYVINMSYTALQTALSNTDTWKSIYSELPYTTISSPFMILNGVQYTYSWKFTSGSCNDFGPLVTTPAYPNGYLAAWCHTPKTLVDARYAFYRYSHTDGTTKDYIGVVLLSVLRDANGVLSYDTSWSSSYQAPYSFLYDADLVSQIMTSVGYNNLGKYSLTDIYNLLQEKLKTTPAEIDYSNILKEIEENQNKQLKETQDQELTDIGIKNGLEEKNVDGTKTPDDPDMNVPKMSTSITDKFPFCVPFDLIALVKTFNAEPVAPKVTIPVVFQSMNYSHDFTFDFSGDNWDKVAAVIRWGTLIFFILGLTLITRNIIKG